MGLGAYPTRVPSTVPRPAGTRTEWSSACPRPCRFRQVSVPFISRAPLTAHPLRAGTCKTPSPGPPRGAGGLFPRSAEGRGRERSVREFASFQPPCARDERTIHAGWSGAPRPTRADARRISDSVRGTDAERPISLILRPLPRVGSRGVVPWRPMERALRSRVMLVPSDPSRPFPSTRRTDAPVAVVRRAPRSVPIAEAEGGAR